MPNWCNNNITISGPTEKMQKIYDTCKSDSDEALCSALYPQPKDIFTGNLGEKERLDYEIEHETDGTSIITGAFDSAWAPPVGAYEHFIDQNPDCHLEAMYHEGGMNYAGMWEDGADDHYELEDTADKIEAQIPEALDQAFGISEWARENEEPEELSMDE